MMKRKESLQSTISRSSEIIRSYSFDSIGDRDNTVATIVKKMDQDCYYSCCGACIEYPNYEERGVTYKSCCFNLLMSPILLSCGIMACTSFADGHFLYDNFEDDEMVLLRPYYYFLSFPIVKMRRMLCLCGNTNGCYDFDIKETGFTDHHISLCGEVRHAICHCPLLCPLTHLIRLISSSNYNLASSKNSPNFYRYYGFEFSLACRLCICCCGRKLWDDNKFHSNGQDSNGSTGIHGAVKADNSFPYNTLMLFGSNPDIPDEFGRTPLFIAAKRRNIRFVNKLINDGCDVFREDDKGVSPFDFLTDQSLVERYKHHEQFSVYDASRHGFPDILTFVLDKQTSDGASINLNEKRSFDNMNPLELACRYSHQSCVEILISHDPLIDPGYSLHFACEAGDTVMISSLLDLTNININKKNENGLVAFALFNKVDLLKEYLAERDFPIQSLETNNYALWFYIIQQTGILISKSIKNYVKKYPELVSCKDIDNRLAVDVATENNKNAIKSVTLWFGRYRFTDRRAEHTSPTCMIFKVVDETQQDDSGDFKKAAIKIMKVKSQFQREVDIRKYNNFDHQYVMNILASYPEKCDDTICDLDDQFHVLEKLANTTIPREVVDKMYCIVMPMGEKNLYSCLKSERWAGAEYTAKVRSTFLKIVDCVQHLHSFGVLHADIKTLNIVRVEAEFVLIDLDAACLIGKEHIGMKSSSAYCPPEAVYVNKEKNVAFVKSLSSYQQYTPDVSPELLVADSSFDIWSLGCILYQLCTDDVRQLFQAGQDDNLSSNIDDDEDSLFTLAEWSDSIKTKKLNKISNSNSRNLVSIMLSKDPNKRPTLSQLKGHPFLSLRRAEKTLKSRITSQWQVFLSYRVNSDLNTAREVYDRLTSKGISVFWDKVSLLPGKNWKEGFCEGLVNCPTFVCIVSRKAINSNSSDKNNYSKLNENSPCDNVLLEHRLALEMVNMGQIQHIFPIMVGDEILTSLKPSSSSSSSSSSGINQNKNIIHDLFFEKGCLPNAPDVCVTAVENELSSILELMGLGTPLEEKKTVSSILSNILQYQGAKIEGDRIKALDDAVDQICRMI